MVISPLLSMRRISAQNFRSSCSKRSASARPARKGRLRPMRWGSTSSVGSANLVGEWQGLVRVQVVAEARGQRWSRGRRARIDPRRRGRLGAEAGIDFFLHATAPDECHAAAGPPLVNVLLVVVPEDGQADLRGRGQRGLHPTAGRELHFLEGRQIQRVGENQRQRAAAARRRAVNVEREGIVRLRKTGP